MKLTLLGTGTSVGVPMIGCECQVCRSGDWHNKRLRSSMLVEAQGAHVLVDATPDLRQQALTYRIPRIDAVVFTHSHADHIFGFDEIRRYNTMQKGSIRAYATPETMADLKRVFIYATQAPEMEGLFRPEVDFVEITGSFYVGGIKLTPLPVVHGPRNTIGYLIEAEGLRVGYVPDCHSMPDSTVALLTNMDVMILDALRPKPHKSHLCVDESVAILKRIGAKQSFLTHMGHDIDHAIVETYVQSISQVRLSYDGLGIEL